MKKVSEIVGKNPLIGWILFGFTVLVVYLVSMLGYSIMERRMEYKMTNATDKVIEKPESINENWKDSFPRQYERWKKTGEGEFASKEGGSVMIDMLERDPRLVVLWAGYGFSKDYNQGRGHYNSVTDIQNTLRTSPSSVATCWTCKSPDVIRVMDEIGPENFYKGKWVDLGSEISNSIGCMDCHDPENQNLKVKRPALLEAMERLGTDVNEMPHQDKRTMVCAQCHVEYYFKGKGKYLTFPWDKGRDVESVEAYYDEIEHADWIHTLSKAPMLKAQHPDFELWEAGIHAQRGVSCADCHMPYRREGGVKFTDHHIQSPLANIANSCQVCHRESEETLRQNVYERQEKVKELGLKAEDLIVMAHVEAKAAWDAGATKSEMAPILQKIRHAQWRWDYVAASHGASFHAPLESARIMGSAINKAQEARIELTRVLLKLGVTNPVPMPDISTKAKAQAYIGLDMQKIISDKREFLKTLIPQWKKEALEKGLVKPEK